jgi:hypothetical protein
LAPRDEECRRHSGFPDAQRVNTAVRYLKEMNFSYKQRYRYGLKKRNQK